MPSNLPSNGTITLPPIPDIENLMDLDINQPSPGPGPGSNPPSPNPPGPNPPGFIGSIHYQISRKNLGA